MDCRWIKIAKFSVVSQEVRQHYACLIEMAWVCTSYVETKCAGLSRSSA